MNIEYVGRGYDVTDSDRALTEDRLEKVRKFLDEPVEVHLSLEVEKHRQIADLHIHHRHGSLQAQEIRTEMAEAIAFVIEKAEKQARRAKKKFTDKRRRAQREMQANGGKEASWPLDVVDGASVRSDEGPRIIKSSSLRIKPMSIEEAALHLDASKNEFVVFRDSDNDLVSVLYRRKDQNFGLIAPGR